MDEVLDALDVDHAPLVAASFGAWMAMQYCLARPQRVARLAMLAPAGIVGLFCIKWYRMCEEHFVSKLNPSIAKHLRCSSHSCRRLLLFGR